MTSHDLPPSNRSIDILQVLARAQIPADPVEAGRQLLTGIPEDRPMEEFYSRVESGLATGVRLIAMPSEGPDGIMHETLAQHGVSVFKKIGQIERFSLLRVPPGARPLTSVLTLFGRNEGWASIFRQVGEIQGLINKAALGRMNPPSTVSLLDRFAVAPSSSDMGVKIYLVPPYYVEEAAEKSFLDRMHQELLVSLYEDHEVRPFMEQIVRGLRAYD